MKKQAYSVKQNIKLVGVFIAGLAVASLGWYYSDRLDIAFGQPSEINIIGQNMGWKGGTPSVGFAPCSPNDRPKIMKKLDGCQVITTTQSCAPYKKYIEYQKTRSGMRMIESDKATRRSVAITKYDVLTSPEIKKDINQDVTETEKNIQTYKMSRPVTELTRDENYQNMLKTREELKKMQLTVGLKCRPVSKTMAK